MTVTIDQDLKDILIKLDQRFDKIDQRFDKIDQKLENLQKEIVDLKIGQTKLEGKIEAIDEKLSGKIEAIDKKLSGKIETLDTKTDQIDKRIGNQEFFNRGIFLGLILLILSSAIKFLGFFPNV